MMLTQPNEALLAILNQLSDNNISSICEVRVCRHNLSFEDSWKLGFRLATEAKGRDVVHFDGHVLGTVFFFYGPQEDLVARAKEALVNQEEREREEYLFDEDDEDDEDALDLGVKAVDPERRRYDHSVPTFCHTCGPTEPCMCNDDFNVLRRGA